MQTKINFNKDKHAVVSLSGGMDSSTVLLKCVKEFKTVTALSFDYGQKHKIELERAQSLVDYLNSKGYNITYKIIKLDGLSSLLNSALVEGGDDVPEGHYAEENMKATVVPNRNKIFASIIQAVALSISDKTKEPTAIALGVHSGDHTIYPDCTAEWRDLDFKAFQQGNWESERVSHYTPYMEGDKFTILQDGEVLCNELNVDFGEVYKRTMTSYKPIKIHGGSDDGWYADYKSASSVERIEAFIKLGRPDPSRYANESGSVSWETARIYVEQVLSEYEKEQLNIK